MCERVEEGAAINEQLIRQVWEDCLHWKVVSRLVSTGRDVWETGQTKPLRVAQFKGSPSHPQPRQNTLVRRPKPLQNSPLCSCCGVVAVAHFEGSPSYTMTLSAR